MKFNYLLKFAMMASSVLASPVSKQAALTDADILQFALTLEHLENTFYKTALTSIPEEEFVQALGPQYYEDLKRIALDEQNHVETLTAGLSAAGAKPVAACQYNFKIRSVQDVISTASILEGVGTSAYLGAAPAIQSKAYLGIAGAILAVEGEHVAILRNAQNLAPTPGAFATAIIPNGAFSLASAFIKSCPSSNGPLPFAAFPKLTAAATAPGTVNAAGMGARFTSKATDPAGTHLTFVSGLKTISVPITAQGQTIAAAIPQGVAGQTYVFVTKGAVTAVSDDNVVSGPAIVEIAPEPATLDLNIL